MDRVPDLLDLVRRGAKPPAPSLRGLGAAWRDAEQAIAGEIQAGPRAARRLVERYGALARRCGEPEARGRAARLAGSFHAYVGEFAEAAARLRTAVSLLEGAARDQARLGLAVALSRTGRSADARRECGGVRRSALKRGDAVLAASADLNDGLAAHESGRPSQAVALHRRARAGLLAAGRTGFAAIASQNLANALVLLDRYEEADPLYAEAAEALAAAGSGHEAVRVRYNRGALLVAMDRLGAAEAELAACERAASAAGDPALAALARLDRGEALLRAGLVAEASRVIESAARSLARGAPAGEVFRAKALRARSAIARDEPGLARRILAAAPGSEAAWDADRRELLALALAAEGRFADAADGLARAARGFGTSRPAARARALAEAGWCALEDGATALARRHARAAAKLASRLRVPSLAHAAAALLFAVEDAAGRRAAAAAALDGALATLEESREGLSTDAMRAAMLRGRERWFARAVRHLLDGPRGEERALALVERWRARSLVELMSSAARIEDAGGRIAALRSRVAALDRRLAGGAAPEFLRGGSSAPPRVARDLVAAERRLSDEMSRAIRAAGERPFSLDEVRGRLGPHAAAVSYFSGDRGGVAFVVRRDGLRAVAPPAADVASLVEELRFRFGRYARGESFVAAHRRRLLSETESILAALSDAVLAPLADALDGVSELVFVPHGALHHVPFAALPFRGRRLVEGATLAFTPSLAALGALDGEAAGGPPLVAAYADGRAAGMLVEARAVAALHPGCRLVEGEAATLDALRAGGPPSVLHVAAHGRFRSDAPAMSGVRLADGWLRTVDFHTVPLSGSLVVLSGCETGVSRGESAGEVEGLVRGVLGAGASDLVVSLWRVEDASTTALMTRFHEALAGGAGPAAALAAAQRAACADGLSPWHWAAFNAWTSRPPGDRPARETRGSRLSP